MLLSLAWAAPARRTCLRALRAGLPCAHALGNAGARPTSPSAPRSPAATRERSGSWLTAAICITLLPTAAVLSFGRLRSAGTSPRPIFRRNVGAADQVWLYPADSALAARTPKGGFRQGTRHSQPFPTLGFKGPIRAGWPAVVSVTPEQAAGFANDPALANVPTIWLVTRQSGIFDPKDDLPAALARVRRPDRSSVGATSTVTPLHADARPFRLNFRSTSARFEQ